MKTLRTLFYLTKRFPMYVIAYFVNEILLALPSYVGNVLLLKYLMLALIEGVPISEMLIIMLGTALFLIAADIYGAWFADKYKPCAEDRVQREFYYHIRNAAEKCELNVYDDPAFYDDMTYINENIVKDSLALLSYVCKITAGLINILLIINLFYEIGFGLLVISISAVILSLAFDVPMVQLQNKRKYAVNSIDRKRKYFSSCFFAREFFLECKMTSITSLLYSRYEESVEEQIACEKKFGVKLFLLSSLRELLSTNLLMNLVLIAYLLYEVLVARTLRGSDFIATYNAVNVVMNSIMQIVKLWGQMNTSTYTIGKYEDFISSALSFASDDMEEKGCEEIHSIEFKNVSFSYPGTEKTVLKDISFRINAGEK